MLAFGDFGVQYEVEILKTMSAKFIKGVIPYAAYSQALEQETSRETEPRGDFIHQRFNIFQEYFRCFQMLSLMSRPLSFIIAKFFPRYVINQRVY